MKANCKLGVLPCYLTGSSGSTPLIAYRTMCNLILFFRGSWGCQRLNWMFTVAALPFFLLILQAHRNRCMNLCSPWITLIFLIFPFRRHASESFTAKLLSMLNTLRKEVYEFGYAHIFECFKREDLLLIIGFSRTQFYLGHQHRDFTSSSLHHPRLDGIFRPHHSSSSLRCIFVGTFQDCSALSLSLQCHNLMAKCSRSASVPARTWS